MELARARRALHGGLGYEFVDLESGSRSRLLRVFIDAPHRAGGVTVDDCARVSDHLTRLFEVENVDYGRLEVSSPGLDRVLRKPADFERFAGHDVQVRMRVPVEGRRNFTGVLSGVSADRLLLGTGEESVSLDLGQVEKVRLLPAYDRIENRHGGR